MIGAVAIVLMAQAAAMPPGRPDVDARAPRAVDIENILQAREFCLISIDACVDGDGRQTIPNNRFGVSNITCRRAPRIDDAETVVRSARCRFTVTTTSWLEEQQVGPARISSDVATFDLHRLATGSSPSGGREYAYGWRQRRRPR